MSKINKVLMYLFVLAFVMSAMTEFLFAQDNITEVVASPIGEWLNSQPWWASIYLFITTVLLVANNITASLPSTVQGSPIYNMTMKALNFASYNFGNNKNADDKPIDEANKPAK